MARRTGLDVSAVFLLVLWCLCQFGMCVTIYPPGEAGEQSFETHRRGCLLLLIAGMALDLLQSGLHGTLLSPWYFPAFLVHLGLVVLAALLVRNALFQKVAVTYMLTAFLLWCSWCVTS